MTPPVRYRFDAFALSPRQRLLLRDGCAVPLIPKYFDLLVLLVRHRNEAVSKHQIFAEVWSDVVVSDGALSQAIRTLRRTLNDNSREPRFIRTVSRHGYQFVWSDVVEEPDDERVVAAAPAGIAPVPFGHPKADAAPPEEENSLDRLVDRLFVARQPIADTDPASTARAMGAALDDVVQQIADQVAASAPVVSKR